MKITNLASVMGTTLALLTVLFEQPLALPSPTVALVQLSWHGCTQAAWHLQLRALFKSEAISVTIAVLPGFQFAVDKASTHYVLARILF